MDPNSGGDGSPFHTIRVAISDRQRPGRMPVGPPRSWIYECVGDCGAHADSGCTPGRSVRTAVGSSDVVPTGDPELDRREVGSVRPGTGYHPPMATWIIVVGCVVAALILGGALLLVLLFTRERTTTSTSPGSDGSARTAPRTP